MTNQKAIELITEGCMVKHLRMGYGIVRKIKDGQIHVAFDQDNRDPYKKEVVQKLQFPDVVTNGYLQLI